MRLGLLLLLAVLAAGCGGGSSSSTLGSVARNDLAIMVLPAAELGDLADGLHVDPRSGFEDSADVAQDTMSPDDTAQDIDDAGFRFGYQLNYTNAGASDEPVQVTSQVSLFESAEAADAFVDETIGGAKDLEGAEVGAGAKVTAVTMEEADEPGDSAWEGSATATAGDYGGLEHGRRLHDRPGRGFCVDDQARRPSAHGRRAGARAEARVTDRGRRGQGAHRHAGPGADGDDDDHCAAAGSGARADGARAQGPAVRRLGQERGLPDEAATMSPSSATSRSATRRSASPSWSASRATRSGWTAQPRQRSR